MTTSKAEKSGHHWRKAAAVFHDRAAEYDSWYDNDSILFTVELQALQKASRSAPFPRVEIGAGPGRFACQLAVTIGIDPALAALQLAAQRGIMPVVGIGEHLPLRGESAGTVFLLFTLCFLKEPAATFTECHRIMKKDGKLIIGMIPEGSPWGAMLTKKKREGNPYYKHARFRTVKDTIDLLDSCCFTVKDSQSTLFQAPDNLHRFEKPRAGYSEKAGCVVLVAEKTEIR